MAAIPLLLDTDIGTSLDDTICLAYLAGSPGFEIVGVSTVTDKGSMRRDYARSILHHYGVDVPVFPGAERSLSGETMQPKLAFGLPSVPAASIPPPGSFAELYADALSRFGEELVVLSIGPFTNLSVAALGAREPEETRPRPRLVSMASSVSGEAEWNVLLDPEAAADVLSISPAGVSGFRERTVVPIETTRRLTMTAEEAADRLPRHLTLPFGDLSRHPRHPGTVVLHDPLAALIILEPKHCTYRFGRIEVSLGSDLGGGGGSGSEGGDLFAGKRGSTHFLQTDEPAPRGGHLLVAVDVARDGALDAILSGLA